MLFVGDPTSDPEFFRAVFSYIDQPATAFIESTLAVPRAVVLRATGWPKEEKIKNNKSKNFNSKLL